jgi:hypothetical protein
MSKTAWPCPLNISIFAISLDKEIAILKIDSEKAFDKFLYYVRIVGLWTEIH